METKFIAYYRVSTKRQNLGLDAQQATVTNYVRTKGGVIVSSYQEKESGKNDNRPQLSAALAECKRTGATLLIAKLDRLSRKVSFVFTLRDSGVKFVATDLPQFNTMTLAVFIGLAQQERELISSRTKAALAELKAKGVKLGGTHKFDDSCRERSLKVRQDNARNNEFNRRAYAAIRYALNGEVTMKELADYLNENGFASSRGVPYSIDEKGKQKGGWRGNQVKALVEMMSKGK